MVLETVFLYFGSKWSFKKFSSLNHNSPTLVLVCLLLIFKRIVVYFGVNLLLFKFLEIICLEFESNFKVTYYWFCVKGGIDIFFFGGMEICSIQHG